MYTATVPITISNFVPIAQGNITANLGGPNNTSAPGSGGKKVFSGTGQSLTVTVPSGYRGAVQLTFQLADTRYVLAGVAMQSKTAPGGRPTTSTGRQQFRAVEIDRDKDSSQMTVTDACSADDNQFVFDYVILVQATGEAPAFQGQIGIIDPDIETETSE